MLVIRIINIKVTKLNQKKFRKLLHVPELPNNQKNLLVNSIV